MGPVAIAAMLIATLIAGETVLREIRPTWYRPSDVGYALYNCTAHVFYWMGMHVASAFRHIKQFLCRIFERFRWLVEHLCRHFGRIVRAVIQSVYDLVAPVVATVTTPAQFFVGLAHGFVSTYVTPTYEMARVYLFPDDAAA